MNGLDLPLAGHSVRSPFNTRMWSRTNNVRPVTVLAHGRGWAPSGGPFPCRGLNRAQSPDHPSGKGPLWPTDAGKTIVGRKRNTATDTLALLLAVPATAAGVPAQNGGQQDTTPVGATYIADSTPSPTTSTGTGAVVSVSSKSYGRDRSGMSSPR